MQLSYLSTALKVFAHFSLHVCSRWSLIMLIDANYFQTLFWLKNRSNSLGICCFQLRLLFFSGKENRYCLLSFSMLKSVLGICLCRLSSEDLNNNRMRLLEEMDTCFVIKWDNLHNKQVDIKAAANLPGLLLGIYQEENKYEDRLVQIILCAFAPVLAPASGSLSIGFNVFPVRL